MRDSVRDNPRHGSWGLQVLVVLIFGLLLAALGWFAGEELDPSAGSPFAAALILIIGR